MSKENDMNTASKTITASEAVALARTNALAGARFADDDDAWASDAWRVLREAASADMTCAQVGGSPVLVSSSRWDGERICK